MSPTQRSEKFKHRIKRCDRVVYSFSFHIAYIRKRLTRILAIEINVFSTTKEMICPCGINRFGYTVSCWLGQLVCKRLGCKGYHENLCHQ